MLQFGLGLYNVHVKHIHTFCYVSVEQMNVFYHHIVSLSPANLIVAGDCPTNDALSLPKTHICTKNVRQYRSEIPFFKLFPSYKRNFNSIMHHFCVCLMWTDSCFSNQSHWEFELFTSNNVHWGLWSTICITIITNDQFSKLYFPHWLSLQYEESSQ